MCVLGKKIARAYRGNNSLTPGHKILCNYFRIHIKYILLYCSAIGALTTKILSVFWSSQAATYSFYSSLAPISCWRFFVRCRSLLHFHFRLSPSVNELTTKYSPYSQVHSFIHSVIHLLFHPFQQRRLETCSFTIKCNSINITSLNSNYTSQCTAATHQMLTNFSFHAFICLSRISTFLTVATERTRGYVKHICRKYLSKYWYASEQNVTALNLYCWKKVEALLAVVTINYTAGLEVVTNL